MSPPFRAAPAQSPALRRYIQDLRRYVQARGAILHDDTGDPAMTLDMYEDGDHIARHARDRYTRMLYERLRMLFRPAPPRNGGEAFAAIDHELDRYMHLFALNRGILMTPFHNMALMSPATSEADVDRHTEVFRETVGALAAGYPQP